LYIGLTNENVNFSGKFPWARTLLHIFIKAAIVKGLLSVIISVEIPSHP
jgi:hypothetical protein